MAKAKVNGGWFKESLRHSQARRLGKATPKINKLMKAHPEYKNLTFKQLKRKGVYLPYQSDSDGDGVKNVKDCRPLNKKAQDNGMPAMTVTTTEPKKMRWWETNSGIGLSERIKLRKEEKISDKKMKAEKTASRIEKELETEEELSESDRSRIQDLEVKELSDKELKILAIREGTGSFFGFGTNKYEEETKRRLREESHFETTKAIIIEEEKKKAKEEFIKETTKKPTKTIFEGLFK